MDDSDLPRRVKELEAEVSRLRRQFDTVIRNLAARAKLDHRQRQALNRQLAQNARLAKAKKGRA